MMHMILHTFTHPLTNTEVAALAIRHWPMPCVIKILSQQPSDSFRIDYITELLRRKKRKTLPIEYVEPTPKEAEFLRHEYELFDRFAFGDLLPKE